MRSEDDELKLSLSAVVIATIAKKRKKRLRARSCWVRPCVCSHPRFGGYNEALLKDLRVSDCKAHQNLCRICNDDYQQILTLISPLITYQAWRTLQTGDFSWWTFDIMSTKSSTPASSTATRCSFVRHVEINWTCQNGNMSNGSIRHVSKQRSTCCFDMLLVWTGLNADNVERADDRNIYI